LQRQALLRLEPLLLQNLIAIGIGVGESREQHRQDEKPEFAHE